MSEPISTVAALSRVRRAKQMESRVAELERRLATVARKASRLEEKAIWYRKRIKHLEQKQA